MTETREDVIARWSGEMECNEYYFHSADGAAPTQSMPK